MAMASNVWRGDVALTSAKNFHEAFAAEDVPMPSERSTGFVFAVVALIVAVLWRSNASVLYPALIAASGFAAIAWFTPERLRALNIAWFKLALVLNAIVSPVVMFVLFAVMIVPFGLVMQIWHDPLRKRRPAASESLWVARDGDDAQSSMDNQF